MTRVEKYRRYREEIANMKFESTSNKKVLSQKIGRMCNDNENSKLGFEQVMNVFDTYDPDAKVTKKRRRFKVRKSQIIYYSVATIVIVSLVIGIIIVASRL